jgi:hypothetical protein
MTPDDRQSMSAILGELCRDMFTPIVAGFDELTGSHSVAVEEDSRMAASVGLSGDEFRGALTLVARTSFFHNTYPPELGVANEPDLVDWARESVNQLLGRIKNRFASFGINFNISIPTVVSGEHLRICPPDEPGRIKKSLRIGGERVDVYFQFERNDGKSLFAPGGPPVPTSNEGDAFLF